MEAMLFFFGAVVVAFIVATLCVWIGVPVWLAKVLYAGIVFYGCYKLALQITPEFSQPVGVWVLAIAISSGLIMFGFMFFRGRETRLG